MALKAGYIGIKKSMLGLINSLASAKLIKSFGDGLNLTSAGKLNMTAATASKIGGVKVGDGLEIEDGVLKCTVSGGFDFSTSEFDTGLKWIDGGTIHGKVFHNVNIPNNAFSLSLTIGAAADIARVLYFNITEGLASSNRVVDMRLYGNLETVDTDLVLKPTSPVRGITNVDLIVFFTKNETE